MASISSYVRDVEKKSLNHEQLLHKLKIGYKLQFNIAHEEATESLQNKLRYEKNEFVLAQSKAVAQMISNLARWKYSNAMTDISVRGERLFFIVWQFPALPLIFKLALDNNVIIAAGGDMDWQRDFRQKNCLCNPETRHGLVSLSRAMTQGRNIATTMDGVYRGSRESSALMFGKKVILPSSILRLIIRNRYRVNFIGPRAEGIQIVQSLDCSRVTVEALSQWINTRLQEEIELAPTQWLFWPSLKYRFLQAEQI